MSSDASGNALALRAAPFSSSMPNSAKSISSNMLNPLGMSCASLTSNEKAPDIAEGLK